MEQSFKLSELPRELTAGLVTALPAVTSCFAYGALIFAGTLGSNLSEGIATSLMTCAATALVVALTSSFRTAIATPLASISAVFAVLVASLEPALLQLPPDQRLPLINAALFATTAATAVAQLLVGFIRAGTLVRFVPYPVIAGFMGASGWFVIAGAIKMTTDVPVDTSSFARFLHGRESFELAILLIWTAILWGATKKIKHPLVLPAGILLASLAANLVLPLLGISNAAAQQQGLFFSIESTPWRGIPALNGDLHHIDWTLLLPVSGEVGAVVLIAVLQTLFLATGLEMSDRTEVDLDRELRSAGWANLASSALGGFVGQIALSATTVNRAAGGRSRIPGVVVSLVALLCLFGASNLLEFIPRFVLGGALLLQGVRVIEQWVLNTRKTLPWSESLLIVAIIVITSRFGFVAAEFGGLLVSCIFFSLSVSRIDVARTVYGLNARTSSWMRSDDQMRVVAEQGSRVQVMELRGFIFFGSAHRLREKVKALVAKHRPLMLIFDFSRVIGINSSAATTIVGISRSLRDKHIKQCVVGLSPTVSRIFNEEVQLDEAVVILNDIDEALEQGERTVLSVSASETRPLPSLGHWLSSLLGSTEHATTLERIMTKEIYEKGEYLCRHGDPTNDLFFIESGTVSAIVDKDVHAPTRVRVFGANTIVGEISFILHVPRTASLRVEENAIVWSLSRDGFDQLAATYPSLVFALLQNMLRIQVEHLSFATRRISALQA